LIAAVAARYSLGDHEETRMTRATLLLALGLLAVPATAAPDPAPKPPYWASLRPSVARMRTGPGRTYPASWVYRRAGLPVRVVAVFKDWRRVADQDGAEGWMQGNLLSQQRMAVVTAAAPVTMHARPGAGAPLAFRAAPGVVGRISECGNGWCRFDVKGQAGYVETDGLWGVEPGERLP
jgi:SH3-like domain-containing protein